MPIESSSLSTFFSMIQKTCLPGVWSKGVSLARADAVIPVQNFRLSTRGDSSASGQPKDGELNFQVRVSDRSVSQKVTLWVEDEDWYCDCEDRNEVCPHVAAVVIALKSGKAVSDGPYQAPSSGQLQYRFVRKGDKLSFDRVVVFPGDREHLLTESLVAFVGGIHSGRIALPSVVATRDDYAVDLVLNEQRRGELNRQTWFSLFKSLCVCPHLTLDGRPVSVSAKPWQIQAVVVDEGDGFRLKQFRDVSVEEVFSNGVVYCDHTLRAVEMPHLSAEERGWLSDEGTPFSRAQVPRFVNEILPRLEQQMPVRIETKCLPKVRRCPAEVVLQLESQDFDGGMSHVLSVIPSVRVQEPPDFNQITEICVVEPEQENKIVRQLQRELQLSPGQRVQFEGEQAIEFLLRAKDWKKSGRAVQAFAIYTELVPKLEIQSGSFEVSFKTPAGSKGFASADSTQVLKAWRENRSLVPLFGGGWAPIPKEWLARYADRVEDFLAMKEMAQSEREPERPHLQLPPYLIPEVAELCREMGQDYPEVFKKLESQLSHLDEIPKAALPTDLKADLRHYQKQGVDWLCFLREAKMGAMLADDMGLGKTLQALCAVRGKTLVVCPTSVLSSWAKQIDEFRPGLPYSVYYGGQRKFSTSTQLVLTTYGLLRMDREILARQRWDTIVLDEAHVIKNPESQVAQAVHSLRGDFRIALSGTPLENRLEDLWSQFHFINPGLLGSLEYFREQFVAPMSALPSEAAASRDRDLAADRLRQRVKPFILRRLKNEVAADLPPRTETLLQCELSSEEREVYRALLVSTRAEVISKLETGGSVFAALELLLRLRQACCHVGLVPGGTDGKAPVRSSKVDLLVQSLENTIACGHRALVFSQWTSYLDLIEPCLEASGIRFSRLDGSTANRAQIVEEFQSNADIKVMLISLKAGGMGLTLTAADHVFLMDPWWNPAVENQAADRAHRIGQVNPVFVHRLIARDTIEEQILELQKVKIALAGSILEDSSTASALTRDDILNLVRGLT